MPQEQSQQRIESLLFYGAVLLIFYLAYRVVEPFLQPLGWAVVLVVCVFPLHQRLRKRWGPMRAAALSTLFVTLLLVVPALALTSGLVNQAWSAVHHIQSAGEQPAQFPPAAQQALDWLSQHGVPGIETDPLKMAREAATWVAHWLADRAGEALRNAASVALKLLILLFALFFLFRDGPALVARTRNVLPFDDAQRDVILGQTRDLIFASVTASLIIGGIQGVLGALAFALVGLPSPIFWGALMGLLSLLPVIGGWLVWGPAVLWLAVNGEYGRAVVLVCICAGVAGTLEHFVRPLLLSGKTQMNSLLILVSVLGGISVFGFLGFILGPIVVALASTILNVYTSPPGEVATVE
ncbi:MAG TPA: AI-2E family transporter [Candidatus Acidoferrales bacterium]|nr:AI-2E family transporter [Candidatus Acidoferrales bacterium]